MSPDSGPRAKITVIGRDAQRRALRNFVLGLAQHPPPSRLPGQTTSPKNAGSPATSPKSPGAAKSPTHLDALTPTQNAARSGDPGAKGRLAGQTSQVLAIEGATGLGRTSLVRHAQLTVCPAEHVPCLQLAASQHTCHSAYHGVTQLLKQMARGMPYGNGQGWLRRTVQLHDQSDLLLPVVEALLPTMAARATLAPSVSENIGADQLRALMVLLFAEYARARQAQALCVLIDDVQWLDVPSLTALLECLEQLAPGTSEVRVGIIATFLSSFGGPAIEQERRGSCMSMQNSERRGSRRGSACSAYSAYSAASDDGGAVFTRTLR